MSSVAGAVALSYKEKREQERAQIRLAKRNKPILLDPGCGGIYWNEPVEKHTITEGILVIVQFRLLPGFTVHDTSSPAGKMWLATLEYISTIRGCVMRYWGTETTQGQESICLLVQSENAKQWGIFQQSLGIYLMYKFMIGRPMNRCLRTSLPTHLELSNRLKVLKFSFDSEVFTTVSEKVLVNWRKWETRWRYEGIEVFGNWLEDDAARYMVELADLIPAVVKGQHKVFLVLAWNRVEESEIVQNEARALEAEFKEEMMTNGAKEFMMNEFFVSKSVQINIKTEKNDSSPEATPQYTIDSLASLLQLSPPRRHSETPVGDHPYFSYFDDNTQLESIYDTAAGKQRFRSIRLQGPGKTDFFLWLKFEPRRLDTGISISKSLMELRESIKKDFGYRASLYWGRSVNDSDEWILMIDWDTQNNHFETNPDPADIALKYQTVQNLLKDFVSKTAALTKEPGAFKVVFPYRSNPRREGFPIMEVTTFEVSSNVKTQLVLQTLYGSYENNTIGSESCWVPLFLDYPPGCDSSLVKQAGRHKYHFFHKWPPSSPALDTEAGEAQTPRRSYFTAITMWRSMDAMREWYMDFASQSEDYQRLGHMIDQIRIFCENIEEIDTKVFNMVGDCYEISKPPLPRYWTSCHNFRRRN